MIGDHAGGQDQLDPLSWEVDPMSARAWTAVVAGIAMGVFLIAALVAGVTLLLNIGLNTDFVLGVATLVVAAGPAIGWRWGNTVFEYCWNSFVSYNDEE